jgi:putative oxidoreductase
MKMNVVVWICRIIAAVIMLQTLFFKFSGAEESVYIFTVVGMEPWGRYAVGGMELIASVLILIPATSWVGAGLALGLMTGAIGMHLTILGINVMGDGGYLFFLALVVATCSAVVLYVQRATWLRFLVLKKPSGVI